MPLAAWRISRYMREMISRRFASYSLRGPAVADRAVCYRAAVASHHQRFALVDVTFAGQPLPGATLDCWIDEHGRARWIARIVTRKDPIAAHGILTGRTASGQLVSGQIAVIDRQPGPSSRRETLCEFRGSGELAGRP
jgi:hypothetical protein